MQRSSRNARPLMGQAPPPQVVQLRTADGVQLAITYYPSTVRAGMPEAKQVTPVVLLHDHKDTRAIFGPLAALLQTPPAEDPNARRLPSSRSTCAATATAPSRFSQRPQQNLDAAKIGKRDVYSDGQPRHGGNSPLSGDQERRRRAEFEQALSGRLGHGRERGRQLGRAGLARAAAGDRQAGPGCEALVMISPRWNFQGLSMQVPMRLRPLKEQAAWMLIYGAEDPDVVTDVRRIEKQLKAFHPETDGNGAPRPADFVVLGLPSKLQGDSLMTKLGGTVNERILNFLIENVAAKEPAMGAAPHAVAVIPSQLRSARDRRL